jgi:hypothetical protein
MYTQVYELTGKMQNIMSDDHSLGFPRISSCCAVVINTATTLIGAHLTVADNKRLKEVVPKIAERVGGMPALQIYFVGVLSYWNTSNLIASFKDYFGQADIYWADTTSLGEINLTAYKNNNSVSFQVGFGTPIALQKF